MHTCQLCSRNFRSALSLQRHSNSFHNKYSRKIKCKVCSKTFSSYGELFRHRKIYHGLPILPENNTVELTKEEGSSANDDQLTTDVSEVSESSFASNKNNSNANGENFDEAFEKMSVSGTNDDLTIDENDTLHHKTCLNEIGECNEMIEYYTIKLEYMKDKNAVLRNKVSELVKLDNHHRNEIAKLREDNQHLTSQLSLLVKNDKDLSLGYFPYTEITKKIYNCTSIKEISLLRNLFKRGKWDEIVKPRNVKVILRLITGIENDAIPICNPQTSVMTSHQRDLFHTIKSLPLSDAISVIKNNREKVESLFEILDQSLRMIVNLFNKYGSRDEVSDTESSNDEYSEVNEVANKYITLDDLESDEGLNAVEIGNENNATEDTTEASQSEEEADGSLDESSHGEYTEIHEDDLESDGGSNAVVIEDESNEVTDTTDLSQSEDETE